MSDLTSTLDDILLVENATEILDEAMNCDFSFVDSLLLNQNNIDLEDEEESPYV